MSGNAVLGAVAGALGGIAGSWMMVRFNHLVGGVEARDGEAPQQHYRDSAAPNEHDGTISDEPGSVKTAEIIGEKLLGRPLAHWEKRAAAPLFHYGFGAVAGAIYGAMAERSAKTTRGFGMPFGATVWATANEAGLPLAGLAAPPARYPMSRHLAALGTHLVFGATTECVRRLLRGKQSEIQ